MNPDGYGKIILAHVLAASVAGIAIAVATSPRFLPLKNLLKLKRADGEVPQKGHDKFAPHLDRTESGRLGRLETFSNYIARQLGFGDAAECPQLCKLATEYLKRTKGCEDDIYEYLSSQEGEGDPDALFVKLTEEMERCILSYFAFHWSQASAMINQVLSAETEHKTKLKDVVFAATRKKRFDRVTKDLKVTRVISTLVEEMRSIGSIHKGEEACTDVMVPVAHSQRSPVLLFMGGGMGAGKSTVLKDILKQPFWAEVGDNAVVIEADAFKEKDVIYQALNSHGRHSDMLQTAELVHQSSTDAASSLLVTALNEGRDIIMDGTLSWVPFVEQTIEMVRNVHKHKYRMGIGYKVEDDGTVIENYWEQVPDDEDDSQESVVFLDRKPYRIELVGVVCDAYLAVIRGIRRAIIMGRAVRVNAQLKSHMRFADAFPGYCNLVDNARLYCTNNTASGRPSLIAWKDGDNKLLIEPEEYKCLTNVRKLNANAESIYELYPEPSPIFEPGSVWNDVILSPERAGIVSELKAKIKQIEDKKLGKSAS
ncbi:hypothetical protein MLD38_018091 [Melastoma candidum]|uniref:Uncharacterized protein n=1 Tax=Melastoma candidum TaxID=119954 RepID=A0ACB9QSX7_9MYRT|nr:hypothetical protein MLD38_018091 [Melastoma candidum]